MNLETTANGKNQKPALVIVDDERSILTELKILLGRSYAVQTFMNPEEVEEFVDNNPVDLIISDELMPEMRGSVLLSQLHKKHPDICKIVLSGQAEKNDIVRAINEGHIFSFLFKPVNQRQLLNVIEKGLENRGMKLTLRKQNVELRNYSENLEKMVRERSAQLVKAHERLQQLDGNKMSFLIYLTHEINSPLDRIQKLAETIITYFGLAGSNLKPRRQTVHPRQTVTELLERKNPDLDKRSLKVDCGIDSGLTLETDPEYLERIFSALLDNAVCFSNEGGLIRISASQENGRTRLSVTDRGAGIDPADLENIFTPFCLEPEKRRPRGFGLNLPVARILTRALDGRIWAESRGSGQGSAFYLEL
ncbi:MAG: response regulator [Deltaproteobacteria bacterium]|nr:response regulator [Deltaproteobacteria bacterium]